MLGDEKGMDLESESRKMEAKIFLDNLYSLDGHNGDNSLMRRFKESVEKKNDVATRNFFLDNAEKIKKLSDTFGFLRNFKDSDARAKHDLSNIAAVVEGFFDAYLEVAQLGGGLGFENLSTVLEKWDRYFIGVEDILLRVISKYTIAPEYNVGLNTEMIGGALDHFQTIELPKIKEFANDSNSAYKKINEKKVDLISVSDWDKIKQDLGDRQISGNSGLIGNFLLNAIRNSIKDRVEASRVRLNVKIEGDWFVVRVEDDGKGIAPKFLEPDGVEKNEETGEEKPIYIFNEGASGTGSTGIGLADFDTRLASVGGELYVVSKQKLGDNKYTLTRFQYGGHEDTKNNIEFDESLEHGTVFEVRLPLTHKEN